MGNLRKLSSILALLILLASHSLAGEMSTPRMGDISTGKSGEMTTMKSGDIHTGVTAADVVVRTVGLYQSLLAVL